MSIAERAADILGRDADGVMREVRAGKGAAGRLVSDPALYEHADALVQQLQLMASELRAGRGTAGKLLTQDGLSPSDQ